MAESSLMFSWEQQDAATVGLLFSPDVLVVNGYIGTQEVNFPSRLVYEFTNDDISAFMRHLTELQADHASCMNGAVLDDAVSTTTTNAQHLKNVTRVTQVLTAVTEVHKPLYLTVPLFLNAPVHTVAYSGLPTVVTTVFNSLGLTSLSVGKNTDGLHLTSLDSKKVKMYVNGFLIESPCSICKYSGMKVSGICLYEIDPVSCICNMNKTEPTIEQKLVISYNYHGITIPEEMLTDASPEDLNTVGGVYYV